MTSTATLGDFLEALDLRAGLRSGQPSAQGLQICKYSVAILCCVGSIILEAVSKKHLTFFSLSFLGQHFLYKRCHRGL